MSTTPRITLEQWRALQAVVEEGGYAQAAEKLHKSQSTVTYAVQQIQKLLDVQGGSPPHPLPLLKRPLTERDLKHHRRIFIRDTGTQRKAEVSGVERRWTVSNKATSIRALVMGLGFAWLPEDTVRSELDEGKLKILPMKDGGSFDAQLYLALWDPEFPGRDVERLAEIIVRRVAGGGRQAGANKSPAQSRRR